MLNFPYCVISVFPDVSLTFVYLLSYFAIIPTLSFKTLFCSHDILSEQSHFLLNYHFFHSFEWLGVVQNSRKHKEDVKCFGGIIFAKKIHCIKCNCLTFLDGRSTEPSCFGYCNLHTVWKFQHFSVNHMILREINF